MSDQPDKSKRYRDIKRIRNPAGLSSPLNNPPFYEPDSSVPNDWLEQIKRRLDTTPDGDKQRLIAEVERLRRDLHDCVLSHQKRNAELAALEEEVERLRKENAQLGIEIESLEESARL